MDQTPAALRPGRSSLPPGPYTVAAYHQLAADGVLCPEDRFELIEGELIWMNPVGSRHAAVVKRLIRAFAARISERALLSVQDPNRLDDRSEPEPDMALLVPRWDDYDTSHPGPQETLLLIEVADGSLGFDRTRKRTLYARHGIVEYWIVNLDENVVEVFRRPGPDGYGCCTPFGIGGVLTVDALSGLVLPVGDLLR